MKSVKTIDEKCGEDWRCVRQVCADGEHDFRFFGDVTMYRERDDGEEEKVLVPHYRCTNPYCSETKRGLPDPTTANPDDCIFLGSDEELRQAGWMRSEG